MKILHLLIYIYILYHSINEAHGLSNATSNESAGIKLFHKNSSQIKLKRREIIDHLDSSKPILFGGSYNLVSEWTGLKDPLNDDQSVVYKHSTDFKVKKLKREHASFKSNENLKIGKLTKNKKISNKAEQKKLSKKDNNLNRKVKSITARDDDHNRSQWSYNYNGGLFRKAARCVDIPSNMSLCRGVGYDRMRVPNLLDHDSEVEAVVQSSYWVPLWSSKCHTDTRIFLCSMFAPVCMEQPIYPCRSLCEAVKNSCVEKMNKHGFPWPEFLECDQFPDDTQLCIGLREGGELQTNDKCSICSPVDSMENIIDNFCNAEFVAKITLERTEFVKGDLKLISNVKKKIYKKPVDSGKRQLTISKEWFVQDYNRCDCPLTTVLSNFKNNESIESQKSDGTRQEEGKKKPKENQYLIMGNKKKGQKGYKLVLNFIQPIKKGSSILNKAMKMLTGDNQKICSTMSG